MMERPTCGTCPYWERDEEEVDDETMGGECRRHAPRPIVFDITTDTGEREDVYWPDTLASFWCGEHPSFPAYVASLEPKPAEANLSPGEKVKAALLNLDEGAGDEIMARMLTPRELEITRLAFGFGEGRVPYTLDEIARIFKVTMPRVRQIHDKAVEKLSLLREVRDASLNPPDNPA